MKTKIKKGDIAHCKLSMYSKDGQTLLFLNDKTYYFDYSHYIVNEAGTKTYLTHAMLNDHFEITKLQRAELKEELPENGISSVLKDVFKYELKSPPKCVVLGEPEINKPIELWYERSFEKFTPTERHVSSFKNVELISRNSDYDLIFAFEDRRNEGKLFLGAWNSGVAE